MIRVFCFFVLIGASLPAAETVFPGLRGILSETEWRRAGLDKLSVDQIGVIDAALIRYDLAQPTVAAPPAPASTFGRPAESESGNWLQRFGLPSFNDDWKSVPPMESKVVKWRGGHRFVLENGQVWEGAQSIPYELPGKTVQIEARPRGQYALIVEGHNTAIRVIRIE